MTNDNPFEPKPKPKPKRQFGVQLELKPGADLTRGQQTAWIVGALVAIAVGWVIYTEKANSPYPWDRCWTQTCKDEALGLDTVRY